VSVQAIRDALTEVQYALGRLEDGTALLRSVMEDLEGNNQIQSLLYYLIDAQEKFREYGAGEVDKLWQQVFAMEKEARP
jgi:hypothetical protein